MTSLAELVMRVRRTDLRGPEVLATLRPSSVGAPAVRPGKDDIDTRFHGGAALRSQARRSAAGSSSGWVTVRRCSKDPLGREAA